MYVLLLILLLGLGAGIAALGYRRDSRTGVLVGITLVLATVLFFALLEFWGEMLWFQAVGYADRFWTLLGAQAAALLLGSAGGLVGAYLLIWPLAVDQPIPRTWPIVAGMVGGGLWGLQAWDEILLFLNRVPTDQIEPILGQDTGFYLFILPLLDSLFWLLLWIAVIGLAVALAASLDWQARNRPRLRESRGEGNGAKLRPLLITSAFLATVLALGKVLDVYHLLYSEWGVVTGPGWTDVHVRLPAYWVVAAAILLLGMAPLLPGLRRRLGNRTAKLIPLKSPSLVALSAAWIAIAGIWFIGLQIVPPLSQWLVVEPNEITLETPYIAHNIRFTRHGFRLHEVEERQFPAGGQFSRQIAEDNQHLLSEVRLWDWRALDAVYKQFQEIRLYYEFKDIDVDRYRLGDRYRQVMVSGREMMQSNLPAQSQTFVNRRFKYTHGYGLTMATVSDFTADGLPNLLVKDIPPQAAYPELQVERPQIYYGELTTTPVVVNSEEQEFDYPRGDENAYIRYPGNGGVELNNLWRKFVFGWKFDGTRFLLSSYPTPQSRIMFHRQVADRVSTLAPFLQFDDDPYIVLAEEKLYWIVDAYTTSRYYPYSQPFSSREFIEYRDQGQSSMLAGQVADYLDGINYIRNSVKAVVDAFEGSVDFYVFEPEDPLIQAWGNAFPGLFKDRDQMPEALQAHIRYPQGFLLAQGLIYAKYHMEDAAVFYNQEDLWVRATEKYYGQVQPVQPYYVMWELPGSDQAEFALILPFTPKNRQVLIGWIAGLCDGENYGRFLAYKFPKEKRVLGPQQVETKIDQDRFLSGQLTLWDQRGSNVIRGNVLAIPIENTLIYVEPIYLEAETAAYPELRLVAVMHGDTLSYGETFDQALQGLFAEGEAGPPRKAALEGSLQELARQANQAFENYLQSLGEQQFDKAAQALQNLRDLLQRLAAGRGE